MKECLQAWHCNAIIQGKDNIYVSKYCKYGALSHIWYLKPQKQQQHKNGRILMKWVILFFNRNVYATCQSEVYCTYSRHVQILCICQDILHMHIHFYSLVAGLTEISDQKFFCLWAGFSESITLKFLAILYSAEVPKLRASKIYSGLHRHHLP